MNFSPSPFWGGVLAVTFYQLVFTNPVSFLSLGLGMVIGFGLSLYTLGFLVVRGYISATQQMAGVVTSALRDNPMLASVFNSYMSSIFNTLSRPSPSCPFKTLLDCYPSFSVSPSDIPVSPSDIPVSPSDIPVSPSDIPVSPSDVSSCPSTRTAAPNLNIGDFISMMNSIIPDRTNENSSKTDETVAPEENSDEVSTVEVPKNDDNSRSDDPVVPEENSDEVLTRNESETCGREEDPISPRTISKQEIRSGEAKPRSLGHFL